MFRRRARSSAPHRLSTSAAVLAAVGLLTLSACGSSSSSADSGSGSEAGGASASAEWPDPFIVAVIPSEDQTELDPEDSVAMQVLEDELGLNIEYHLATSYAATIEAQRSGQAHMASYGPFSYVLAADSGAGVEPIAASAEAPDEQSGYHSVASVRADSDIDSLEDAKGRTVCFVDPGSTSGYLFPSAGLLEAGIDPESADITPVMAGGHDASILALADGQCDIAFSTEGMVTEQLIESGQIEEGQFTQIWESELIPSNPYALSTDLPEDLRAAVTETMLEKVNVDHLEGTEYWDETAEDGFGGLGRWGYVAVEDSDYDGIRSVCETTQSEACAAAE